MKNRSNPQFRPPKHLSTEAKRLFRFLRDEYGQDGDEDNLVWKTQLEATVQAYDRYREIVKTLDRDGIFAPDKKSYQPALVKLDPTIQAGRSRPNPLLAAEAAARTSFLQCLKGLGIGYETIKEIGRPKGS